MPGPPTADAAGPSPAPRFDTVRVAPDGSGLVAGQAEPGTEVAVLAGEEVAAEATADGDGRFVAFLDLAPSAEPRALSLRDGSGGLSEETVIVAPTGEVVAGGRAPWPRPGRLGTGSVGARGGASAAAAADGSRGDRRRDARSAHGPPTPDLALAEGPR